MQTRQIFDRRASRRPFLRSRWLAARICGQLIWIKGGDEMACTEDSLFPKEQVPASRPPPSTPVRSGPSLLLRSASRARVRRCRLRRCHPMTLGNMRANGVRSLMVSCLLWARRRSLAWHSAPGGRIRTTGAGRNPLAVLRETPAPPATGWHGRSTPE
jgi:hypothetical protein